MNKRYETHPVSESLKDFGILAIILGGVAVLGVGLEAL